MTTCPNVVVIVLDTVRRDRVSAYGYDRETTPRFDAFADEAVLFEDAISQSSWSIPAHASLFTGLYPSAHGATTIQPVLQARRPLPSLLQSAGYETFAVSPNEYVRPATGFGDGFDEFYTGGRVRPPESVLSVAGPLLNRLAASPRVRRPLERGFNWLRQRRNLSGETGIESPPAYGVSDRVASILSSASEPFFLFVNLPHAHLPRSPEREYCEQFVDESLPVDAVVTNERSHNFGNVPMSDPEIQAMSDLYDADLRTLDDRLGELLDVLSGTGTREDSLVIITADHGEHLGEYGLVGHQHSVFEPVVSVPLAVDFPGAPPDTVSSQVETRRVYHTALDVAGVRSFPHLSLGSKTGDVTVQSTFHSPMLDLAALLREGQVTYDTEYLGEPLRFRRENGSGAVTFGDTTLELSDDTTLDISDSARTNV